MTDSKTSTSFPSSATDVPALVFAERPASRTCLVLRVALCVLVLAIESTAFAASVTVSSGESLSEAIRSAVADDIITVKTGTYLGNLIIDKNLTIQAENGAKVVIEGVGSDPTVAVNPGVRVTLTRLILRHAGTGVLINGGTVVLQNLAIAAATPIGTAVRCENTASASVEVRHVTIHRAEQGLVCAASTLTIENNIVSNVTGRGMDLGALTLPGTSRNLFFQTPNTGVPSFQSVDVGLGYVDETASDFHLTLPEGVTKETSPAIDKGSGSTDAFDSSSPPDLGAYGGAIAHSVPFPPADVSVRCIPGGTQCAVKWTANTDYNVSGYRIVFWAPLLPSASTQVGTASEGTSPLSYAADDPAVCSSGACQVSLSGLLEIDPSNSPAAPAGLAARFRDSGLDLTWNAVPQATSYQVLLGTTSGSLTVVPGQDRIEGTSASLSNLINGQQYFAAVKAAIEPRLTAEVASLYGVPVGTTTTVSSGSDPRRDRYGTAVLGPASSEVSETPEAVAGFPPLADTGGCFIATAAYGSPLAPQVALLRTWRDRYLAPNPPGRALIKLYETMSPPVAEMLRHSEALRALTRWTLAPVIGGVWVWLEWPLLPLLTAVGFGVVLLLMGIRRASRKLARE